MEVKEMIYEPSLHFGQKDAVVLADDTYNDTRYVVVSYHTHPCAYIQLNKDLPIFNDIKDDYNYDDLMLSSPHGGITYMSDELCIPDLEDNHKEGMVWIGWDYAHAGDYIENPLSDRFNFVFSDDKKWTTWEIIQDCIRTIDELEEDTLRRMQ